MLSVASGGCSDGSNEDKETLRAQHVASVIQFLDAFQEASIKFPTHRNLIGDAKAKARRLARYFWPGMLLSDYDWSENGVIANARQIQSEYWALTHYSLFISITTYLIVEAWLNRTSYLHIGTEVTVEPEDAVLSTAERLSPAKGSFYAVVHSAPTSEGEDGVYSVTVYDHPDRPDGTVIAGIPPPPPPPPQEAHHRLHRHHRREAPRRPNHKAHAQQAVRPLAAPPRQGQVLGMGWPLRQCLTLQVGRDDELLVMQDDRA